MNLPNESTSPNLRMISKFPPKIDNIFVSPTSFSARARMGATTTSRPAPRNTTATSTAAAGSQKAATSGTAVRRAAATTVSEEEKNMMADVLR